MNCDNCIHDGICANQDWDSYREGCSFYEPLRQKGKWIEGRNGNIKCNQCGAEIRYGYVLGCDPAFPKFCCECGADMRGDKE